MLNTTITTETYEELAIVDGIRYLAVCGIYRQDAQGHLTFYCAEPAWLMSNAAKLAAAQAEIERLQTELATLRQVEATTTNGHADDYAPVTCPICGESYRGRAGLKVHMPKIHGVRLADYEAQAQNGHVPPQIGHPQSSQREPADDTEDSQYADYRADHD